MDAFVVATGERHTLSRAVDPGLQALTGRLPAPLLPLLDRPLLIWIVELLARQGVGRVVVALNEAAGQVEKALGDGRRWGLDIEYVLQREPLGDAGALKWAQRLFSGPVLLLPGDALIDVDVNALVACRRRYPAPVTALMANSSPPLRTNGQGQAGAGNGQPAATGVYVVEPAALALAPPRTRFDIHEDLLPALRAAGQEASVCRHEGYWNPLCSAEQLQQGQLDLLRSAGLTREERLAARLPLNPDVPGTQMAPGIWVGKHNVIHPNARLRAPVFIGDDCRIGPNVELGPEAIVSSQVIVDEAATVHHSTVLPHTYVGRLVDLGRRVVQQQRVIDLASGQSTELVDEFLLAPAHPAAVDQGARRLRDVLLAALLFWLMLPVYLPLALVAWLGNGSVLQRVPHRVEPEGQRLPLLLLHTRRPDGRYLPLGRMAERAELRRLPQLLNVVSGDLALVGLAPLPLEVAEEMDATWLESRRGEAAGFTGLWYVETAEESSLDELLAADALFAATRSWQDELRLLARTPAAWHRRVTGKDRPRPLDHERRGADYHSESGGLF